MSFCKNCGSNLPEGTTFCSSCGTPVEAQTTANQQSVNPQPQQYQVPNQQPMNNDVADAQDNKFMGVLAYIGILFLVPLFAAKQSKFAQFHAKQGLTLFVFEVAYSIFVAIINGILKATVTWSTLALFGTISSILNFLNVFFFVVAIIGIVNAVKGECKELPLIGKIDFIAMFSKNK
ncbi:MAG: zinc-ribbon domain-containing protein [Ruminococcus sp.]|nr:zinc-ribbon domain-containing protein [Ruminococcus sp.]